MSHLRSVTYVFLVVLSASTALAQAARVQVVEAGNSQPIAGVIVSLMREDGRRVEGRLTDTDGSAVLRADTVGTYRVRAERVGFEAATSAPVELRGGDQLVRIELAPRRVRLGAVTVKGKRQCGHDVAQAANTLTLWDEVRKALTASVLTQGERPAMLPVRTYSRLVDRRLRVESETTHVRTSTGGSPFRSAPPDDLARKGFVRDLGGMVFDFYGPDAALLLSDPFVRDHCFSIVQGQGENAGLVGLAFQPVDGRQVSDIAGALWLDRRSAELRYVDYRYTRLPQDVLAERAGGRVEFTRLPDGRWIVERWQIRTPRLATTPERQIGGFSVARRYEVIGYKEEGGMVLTPGARDLAANAARPQAEVGSVEGVAYDSLRGTPLVGAQVRLEGTAARDTTDALGRYRLGSPLPGEYTLSFEHARFAELGIPPVRLPVRLSLGSDSRVDAGVPSASALRELRCNDPRYSRPGNNVEGVLVMGVVRHADGAAVPGAAIEIWWSGFGLQRSSGIVAVQRHADTVEVQADSLGAFAFCGVPRESDVAMRAVPDGAIVRRTYSADDVLAEVVLTIGARLDRPVAIRGRVASTSAGRPLGGAEVTILELSRSTRTSDDGSFAFTSVPPGRYQIIARSVGYSPEQRSVLVDQSGVAALTLSLSPVAPELAGVSVEARRVLPGNQREFERRRAAGTGGTFLTREMLAAREESRLSDVLRTHASGVRFVALARGGKAAAGQRSSATIDSRRPRECYMQIILDGVRVFTPSQASSTNPPPDIDQYAPNGLESIEVYAGSADTPVEYGGTEATCGTIVLWTRDH